MSNINLYDEKYVQDLKEIIENLETECRLWRTKFLDEYAQENKLHKDEYDYLYKSLNDMGEISFEFIGFYDLVTHLRNNFKVQKILEKFSYSQILEKMGE